MILGEERRRQDDRVEKPDIDELIFGDIDMGPSER